MKTSLACVVVCLTASVACAQTPTFLQFSTSDGQNLQRDLNTLRIAFPAIPSSRTQSFLMDLTWADGESFDAMFLDLDQFLFQVRTAMGDMSGNPTQWDRLFTPFRSLIHNCHADVWVYWQAVQLNQDVTWLQTQAGTRLFVLVDHPMDWLTPVPVCDPVMAR